MRPIGVGAVVARDLRRLGRARHATLVIPTTVALGAVIVYAIYRSASGARRGAEGVSVLLATGIGRATFHSALFVVLAVCCLVVPVLGADAVAGERERGTLLPLQMTGLRPLAVALGKFASMATWVLVLVLTTLPVLMIAYVLGGITSTEIARGTGMVTLIGITIAALSVAISSLCEKASTATLAAYAMVAMLVFGTLAAFGIQALVTKQTNVRKMNHATLLPNPLVAVADVVAGPSGTPDRLPSPFTPFVAMIGDRITSLDDLIYVPSDGGGFIRRFRGTPVLVKRSTPAWRTSVYCYLVLLAGSLVVTTRRLRLPRAERRTTYELSR